MRKLHLASFKFKVGDNEFEEIRQVASYGANKETITDDAVTFWKREALGTDRILISCTISETLSDGEPMSEAAKRSLEIRQSPANFKLTEIFKELKFGRPAASQHALDRFIQQLEDYDNEALDEKEVVCKVLDQYAELFPELNSEIDWAKKIILGINTKDVQN